MTRNLQIQVNFFLYAFHCVIIKLLKIIPRKILSILVANRYEVIKIYYYQLKMWVFSKKTLSKILLLFCVGRLTKALLEKPRFQSNIGFMKKHFLFRLKAEMSKKAGARKQESWREAEKLCKQRNFAARLVQIQNSLANKYLIAYLTEKLQKIARKTK